MKWNNAKERVPEKPDKYYKTKMYLVKYENGVYQTLSWADGWNCVYEPDWTVSRKHEITDVLAWIDPDEIED